MNTNNEFTTTNTSNLDHELIARVDIQRFQTQSQNKLLYKYGS